LRSEAFNPKLETFLSFWLDTSTIVERPSKQQIPRCGAECAYL
jgi:hypothetical protein